MLIILLIKDVCMKSCKILVLFLGMSSIICASGENEGLLSLSEIVTQRSQYNKSKAVEKKFIRDLAIATAGMSSSECTEYVHKAKQARETAEIANQSVQPVTEPVILRPLFVRRTNQHATDFSCANLAKLAAAPQQYDENRIAPSEKSMRRRIVEKFRDLEAEGECNTLHNISNSPSFATRFRHRVQNDVAQAQLHQNVMSSILARNVSPIDDSSKG